MLRISTLGVSSVYAEKQKEIEFLKVKLNVETLWQFKVLLELVEEFLAQ